MTRRGHTGGKPAHEVGPPPRTPSAPDPEVEQFLLNEFLRDLRNSRFLKGYELGYTVGYERGLAQRPRTVADPGVAASLASFTQPEPDLPHTLLHHAFCPPSIPEMTVYSGTCSNPYCRWGSSDCTGPATVQHLFEEHLKSIERNQP